MPLTTPQSIVSLALKSAGILGVGQSALAEDNNDAFDVLNAMVGSWAVDRWLIFQELDKAVTITGSQTYTIGPGGDIDVPRCDRIEAAYFRQFPTNNCNVGPVDFPLRIIQSMEDYSQIALKTLTTWPVALFFDSGNPGGILYPVPIPNIVPSELHVIIKQNIAQFASLVQSISLPQEYIEPLWTNLTIRLCAIYPGAVLTPVVAGLAKASLSKLRMANTQISAMSMPAGMSRPPLYNIYSGMTY